MALTVLTDDQIRSILETLSLEEAKGFRKAMERALQEYSADNLKANGGSAGCGGGNVILNRQPPRTSSMSPSTGATSLFMPSTNSGGVGVKVVTLMAPPPPQTTTTNTNTNTDNGPNGNNNNNNDGNDDNNEKKVSTRPTGAITLISSSGEPIGLLHARSLTAFRTALASSLLMSRRKHVRRIVCFGAGEQAYWHLRLCLMFRGATVENITLVNVRRREVSTGDADADDGGALVTTTGDKLISRLLAVPLAMKQKEGWAGGINDGDNDETRCSFTQVIRGRGKIGAETGGGQVNEDEEDEKMYKTKLEKSLTQADIIITTTPSTTPLFPINMLYPSPSPNPSAPSRVGSLIVAIGSYQIHMTELPSELLVRATTTTTTTLPTERGSGREDMKKLVVDTIDGAMEEAGEVCAACLGRDQLVELGELVGILNEENKDWDEDTNNNTNTARWLREGDVIYKSVGVGVMDLATGMHLVEIANEKGVGTRIDGF